VGDGDGRHRQRDCARPQWDNEYSVGSENDTSVTDETTAATLRLYMYPRLEEEVSEEMSCHEERS